MNNFNKLLSIFQVTIAYTIFVTRKYCAKMHIQTLLEFGFGYRIIVANFWKKDWKLCSAKAVSKWADILSLLAVS